MMISDSIARQGSWLFRRRSYVILGFAPIFLFVATQPEPIEMHFGALADSLYESACILLAFAGLAIRAATVGFVPAGTSGRNTQRQIAETLNTTGLYSLTRNPLYFGNAVTMTAIALFSQDVFVVLLMLLFQVVYHERIIATEERFLGEKFGHRYADWAARVPAFFPRLTGWVPPALPFSLKNVLRREYSSFFAIVAIFFTLDQVREVLAERHTAIDPAWLAALTGGAAVYVGLRWLKKRTKLLKVVGR
ncbi:methyltransferase family protein [Kumtagia ephedrae]|jgi:protein-S-isoprenylcysteine O-methyltransferase Ste14|nr:isoprenylcysteine carboxylmethyltransferase family protein [Mesorhizobium ephedrae]